MRISKSDGFHGRDNCPSSMSECARQYCAKHRLLWNDCETAILTHEGSGRPVFELGDCPLCGEARRREEALRLAASKT